jgi:hypothetical protein
VLKEGSTVILLICYGVGAAAGEERGVVEIAGGSSRVRPFSSEGTNLVFRISVPVMSSAMHSDMCNGDSEPIESNFFL